MECGSCTLCCKLLEIHDIPSKIGEYCQHCKINEGCGIYNTRPKECRDYKCMWLQMENAGIELRPDNSGIIFDRIADDVITARLEEGKSLNDLTYAQVMRFNYEGFSVMVFRGRDRKCFLAKGHNEQYVLDRINDRAKLYRRSE